MIILGIKSVLFQNKVVGYLSNEFVTTYLGLGFDFDHAHYKGIVARIVMHRETAVQIALCLIILKNTYS